MTSHVLALSLLVIYAFSSFIFHRVPAKIMPSLTLWFLEHIWHCQSCRSQNVDEIGAFLCHMHFVLVIFQRSSSCLPSKDLPGSNLRSLSLDFCPPARPAVMGSPSLPLLYSQIIYPNLQSRLAPITVPEGRTLEREYLDLKPAPF